MTAQHKKARATAPGFAASQLGRPAPHNLETEQALLGAIIVNNKALDRVADFLKRQHFYDPLHQQIFETAVKLITAGTVATLETLKTFLPDTEPIDGSLTIAQYLGRLAGNATTIINARDYGRTIYDLATRRDLIVIGQGMVNVAYESPVDFPPREQIEKATTRLQFHVDAHPDRALNRITAKSYVYVPAENIPPRPVMYAGQIRGQVSTTVGRPGTAKTKLEIVEALAKVTGRQLLHDQPRDRYGAWCWFGEEDPAELDRLLTAAMNHYGITQEDIEGRLLIHSRKQKLNVASYRSRNGLVIARPVVKEVKRVLREHDIDSLTIDPFVKSHGVPENDNTLIDQVTGIWGEIAEECRCHIDLVHHTRKTGGEPVTIDDIRGGSAIVGAVRYARILNAMTPAEARQAGVEPAWAHVRVDDGKTNNLPPTQARWIKLETKDLAHGDIVGVATPWHWSDRLASLQASDLRKVQDAVAAGPFRKDAQADGWVGTPIASALGLDANNKNDRKRIKKLLDTWITSGVLVEVKGPDKNRKEKTFIRVGKWQTG